MDFPIIDPTISVLEKDRHSKQNGIKLVVLSFFIVQPTTHRFINQKFQNQYYWGCLINVFFGCWCLLNVNQILFVLQSSQCFRRVVFLQCLVCCFLNFAAIFPLVIHVSSIFHGFYRVFHHFPCIFLHFPIGFHPPLRCFSSQNSGSGSSQSPANKASATKTKKLKDRWYLRCLCF